METIVAYIDNERLVFDAENDFSDGLVMYPTLEVDGMEFYLFEDSKEAGEEARRYWKGLAQDDPQEFTCIVGEKALVAWALGQNYGPGSIGVNSLEEWLDLYLTCPEEHFASYDGEEKEFKCKHPEFKRFTVAYRHN